MKKAAVIFLCVGAILCFLQVLLPAYFLTGDGPCHVYNAYLLHDFWNNNGLSFFNRFYTLNKEPDPNWVTHIILALLMYIVSGAVAEKLLLIAYIALFVSGFYFLLKKLSPNAVFWPLVIFVFVFHHLLIKGFYNFSFSIAFLNWWLWSWLRYLDNKKVSTFFMFFLFAALTFFTHAMAFVYGCITCVALLISYTIAGNTASENRKRPFIKSVLLLLIALAPFILLLLLYGYRHPGSGEIKLHPDVQRYHDLYDFHSLVNRTHSEDFFASAVAYLLVALFILSVITRLTKPFGLHKYDGFLVSLFFAFCVYLFFPDSLLGGGLLVVRAQLLMFIFLCYGIGYMPVFSIVKDTGAIILFTCFICMSIVRIPSILAASAGTTDYNSAGKYIRPYSIVLPLSFSHNGKDERGNLIADRNWLFCHAAQYIGQEKPLVLLDNYEANTGYFPVLWKDGVNPYRYLSKEQGIEGQPPFAAIEDYKKETGVSIDYIITWCYDSAYLSDEHVKQLVKELNEHYHIIYTSSSNRTVLYEINRQ